jgi:hypothetical protein
MSCFTILYIHLLLMQIICWQVTECAYSITKSDSIFPNVLSLRHANGCNGFKLCYLIKCLVCVLQMFMYNSVWWKSSLHVLHISKCNLYNCWYNSFIRHCLNRLWDEMCSKSLYRLSPILFILLTISHLTTYIYIYVVPHR